MTTDALFVFDTENPPKIGKINEAIVEVEIAIEDLFTLYREGARIADDLAEVLDGPKQPQQPRPEPGCVVLNVFDKKYILVRVEEALTALPSKVKQQVPPDAYRMVSDSEQIPSHLTHLPKDTQVVVTADASYVYDPVMTCFVLLDLR